MKKLVLSLVAATFLFCGSAFGGEVPHWSHSLPGFNSYISTPTTTTYRVQSWSNQSQLPATGYMKTSTSYGSYKATFNGKTGYAKGSTSITYSKTGNGVIVRSSASAYSSTK